MPEVINCDICAEERGKMWDIVEASVKMFGVIRSPFLDL